MEQIFQDRKIAFSAVTNKSLIAMVPVMDVLIKDINNARYSELYHNFSSEERKERKLRYPNGTNLHITAKQVQNAYSVLTQIGFVGSGEVEIMLDDELLAENSKE